MNVGGLLLRNNCRWILLNPRFKNIPQNNQAISPKEALKFAAPVSEYGHQRTLASKPDGQQYVIISADFDSY